MIFYCPLYTHDLYAKKKARTIAAPYAGVRWRPAIPVCCLADQSGDGCRLRQSVSRRLFMTRTLGTNRLGLCHDNN